MDLQLNTANFEQHNPIRTEERFGLNLVLKSVVKYKTGEVPVVNFVVLVHGNTAYEGQSLEAAVSCFSAMFDQQTLVF